jgi:hypothetical protein
MLFISVWIRQDPGLEILTGSRFRIGCPKGDNYRSEKVIFSHQLFQYRYLSFNANNEKNFRIFGHTGNY